MPLDESRPLADGHEETAALASRLGTDLLLGALIGSIDLILDGEPDEDGYEKLSVSGDRQVPPAIAGALRAFLGDERTSWGHTRLDDDRCSCGSSDFDDCVQAVLRG